MKQMAQKKQASRPSAGTLPKASTGIQGLDEIIGGGLPRGRPTLVSLGMRERAAILGGQVNISSAAGKGTTVTAWIPLPSREESGAIPITREIGRAHV